MMQYDYTAYYKTDEERIQAIVEDILREYPNLGTLAEEAAKLETPFGRVHEDYDQFSNQENHINRLIDIVIVTEGKQGFEKEYEKACKDLRTYYESWRRGFTYANPEEQPVYLVMQRFEDHRLDSSKPLITIKDAEEIIKVKKDAERREREWIRNHTMQYNYTAYYKTEEERIQAIVEDILREYPNLGTLAEEAAKLETPFGRVHEDYDQFSNQENHINRLIDIVIVTEGKQGFEKEYEKACKDLRTYYESWRRGFTYANPEEQSVYLIMQVFDEHMKDKSIPLMTMKEASIEQRKRKKEKDIEYKADMLRSEYPNLGDLATEVIRLEVESGVWLRFQENDLIRLVSIIKLSEDREEYSQAYIDAINTLNEKYEEWLKYETSYMSEEKQIVMEMVNRLKEHLMDKSVPILTYAEIKNGRLEQRNQHNL